MSLLFFAFAYIISLPYAVIAGVILVILALWVLDIWVHHMREIRNPLDRELSQASHGASLLLLTPLFTHVAFLNRWTYWLPPEFTPFVWPVTFALMALGLFWLVVGAYRTRTNFRDAQLIARSLVKIAVGVGIGWLLYQSILPPQGWPYRFYLHVALFFLMLWCGITGLTKLVLLLRGPPRMRHSADIEDMPHGDAGFGSDLR
jgi:hypothetical protein